MHICVSVYWVVVVAQLVELGCIIKLNKKLLYKTTFLLTGKFFLLAGPSQDVFLLPHIPYEGKGVVYFLYITL